MTASAPCSSAGSPCSTRTGFDYLNTSTGCATSCIDPACRNNAVVCAVRRSFPAPFLTGRIAPSRPPTQKNTPTPEGAGANAWLDAGAANSGCHAEGKEAGWHSGGFPEVFSKRLNVLDAGIRNLLAGDLLQGAQWNTACSCDFRPMSFGVFQTTKNVRV